MIRNRSPDVQLERLQTTIAIGITMLRTTITLANTGRYREVVRSVADSA